VRLGRGAKAAEARPAVPDLADHVRVKAPEVFITLVSILIGIVFADLVAEARARMHLWPLDGLALRTLGQITGTMLSGLAAWATYAYLAISRRHLPWYGETLSAVYAPLLLLVGNSFVGLPVVWPWLYAASAFLALGAVSLTLNVNLVAGAEGARFRRILRPFGCMVVVYLGVPAYFAAALADQFGRLPEAIGLLFSLIAGPAAVAYSLLFFRDWRRALDGAD